MSDEELDRLRARVRDDEKLLRQVERALVEIKVASGLSEAHASVLAAIRIRLKGDPGKNLEDVLSAAGDIGGPGLEELMSKEPAKKSGSLDDLLAKKKPKPEWPSGVDATAVGSWETAIALGGVTAALLNGLSWVWLPISACAVTPYSCVAGASVVTTK